MSDLIDRQKAINVIERMRAYIGHNMERAVGSAFIEILDDVGEDIGRLPSVRLEIIRCKDCKYAEYIDDVQTLWCTECGQGRTVAPYDFCSYGERRADG